MELNALYFHHQTSIMNGASTGSDYNEQSGFDLVTHYSKRIMEERRRLGYRGYDWQAPPSAILAGIA